LHDALLRAGERTARAWVEIYSASPARILLAFARVADA